MKRFAVEKDTLTDDKYIVSVRIVIYRNHLGCYPDFLKEFENPKAARDGYSTKFWYVVPNATELSYEKACQLRDKYESEYKQCIDTCEETGDWSEYPWKEAELIYSK